MFTVVYESAGNENEMSSEKSNTIWTICFQAVRLLPLHTSATHNIQNIHAFINNSLCKTSQLIFIVYFLCIL